jgi:hypothetical protein
MSRECEMIITEISVVVVVVVAVVVVVSKTAAADELLMERNCNGNFFCFIATWHTAMMLQ